jgi:hypothetical protein
MKRKTVDRATIVEVANRMIAHLADSGTHTDLVKRNAIIAVTQSILLEGESYAGFSYLNPPLERPDGLVYDDSRIALL